MPMTIADMGFTNPEAGVMHTKPATAPEHAPSTLGLPRRSHSITAHVTVPAAAAKCVAANAADAIASDCNSLPALNPNQPIQSRAAPTTVYVRLWGGIGSLP